MNEDSASTETQSSPETSPGEALAPASSSTVSDGAHAEAVATGLSASPATLPVLKIPFAKDEPAVFGLRRGDQLFVATCVLAGLALLYLHWIRLSRGGAEPIEIDRLPERRANYRLDINQATKYEWAELDGIGETLAERIVQNRDQNGPFGSVEDLKRVRGIGPKILEKLAPHLQTSGDSGGFSVEQKPSRRKR